MIADVGSSWSAPLCTPGSTGWRPRIARALGDMQMRAMRDTFPSLKVLLDLPWVTIWQGYLTPLSETYRVRIVDHRGMVDGRTKFAGRWPNVRLLTPVTRRAEEPLVPIPHIYGPHDDPRGADLCLFHPLSRDWNVHMLMAESIIPWTAEWLFYYELWQVTGVWGGDEAEHRAAPSPSSSRPPEHLRRGPLRRIDCSVTRSLAYLMRP